MERKEMIQIGMLVLMVIFVILLIFVISIFIKEKDLIKTNPIDYGVKKYNFTYCNCFKDDIVITFPVKKGVIDNVAVGNNSIFGNPN